MDENAAKVTANRTDQQWKFDEWLEPLVERSFHSTKRFLKVLHNLNKIGVREKVLYNIRHIAEPLVRILTVLIQFFPPNEIHCRHSRRQETRRQKSSRGRRRGK